LNVTIEAHHELPLADSEVPVLDGAAVQTVCLDQEFLRQELLSVVAPGGSHGHDQVCRVGRDRSKEYRVPDDERTRPAAT
jgi:hypothetical protein